MGMDKPKPTPQWEARHLRDALSSLYEVRASLRLAGAMTLVADANDLVEEIVRMIKAEAES